MWKLWVLVTNERGSALNLRKYQRQYKFNDKTTPRHKHNYIVDAIAEVHHGSENFILHYKIIKCDKCSSFYCVPRNGTMSGFTNEIDSSLPMVRLKTSHKHLGFHDLTLI